MKLTNERTQEVIESPYTHEEAAVRLAELEPNSWLWFHIHKAVQPRLQTKSQSFLADAFVYAVGMGLKRPMVRVHFVAERFCVYLSTRGTLCLKAGMCAPGTYDPDGPAEYVGCWVRGKFLWNNRRTKTAFEEVFLKQLEQNPVEFLAKCSKDMNRCCYCGLPLDDPRSVEMGYGPVCARRWGLPWGYGTKDRVPTFAEHYDESVHGICQEIREAPRNEHNWQVFGDWCEERGILRPTMPERAVRVPSV